MKHKTTEQSWIQYRDSELARVTPLLTQSGYTLDTEQKHIIGERYLLMHTHDVGGGGKKLVLTGIKKDTHQKVIIKATSDAEGKKEIGTERRARHTIQSLNFSYAQFRAPKELLHQTQGGLLISITEYIEQERSFLERPIEEQCLFGLKALKIQESVHATTYSHTQTIRRAFGSVDSAHYLRNAHDYAKNSATHSPALTQICNEAVAFLTAHTATIEQYCGFLTHADFVPHNLRIRDGEIYLLDYASIHFGNKYESWARFLNFMLLYNPPLEQAFVQYVRDNRTPEESASLNAMRVYKLLFLLHFHTTNLAATTGNQRILTEARIAFWSTALEALLQNKPIDHSTLEEYKKVRDSLRSAEEVARQHNLH